MSNEEKTRTNSTSQLGGRNYYPSIEELLHADSDGFKHLTDELTKDWILCLPKDTIGHLREA